MNGDQEKSQENGSSSLQHARSASVGDSLTFTLLHLVPYLLRGVFTKNPFWTFIFDSVDTDGRVVKFCQRLRSKYRSELVYLNMLTGKSLLLFSEDAIKRVLNNSPSIYGVPDLKRSGMSHFQPNAVTISEGEEWRERRRFNETVLNSNQKVHEHADAFLAVIKSEVQSSLDDVGAHLGWKHFDRLFKRITLQVIFGASSRRESELPNRLHQMMTESNRIVFLHKSKQFDALYQEIRDHLASPQPDSLTALCPHAPHTDNTRVENQIPHWMFAMMETLATNTLRALALIVSHPSAEARVRLQINKYQSFSPSDISSFAYLKGCLQEAMRLWPTTSMLARKTLVEDSLCGNLVPTNVQIIILNTFNHRDSETHYFADHFKPELWLEQRVDYHFNHLSNGAQVCAGFNLALFIGTAVLAELLRKSRYKLRRPSLNPARPLPHSFNEFRTKLERMPLL